MATPDTIAYTDPAMANSTGARYVVLYSNITRSYLRAGIGATSVLGLPMEQTTMRERNWDRNTEWEVFQIIQVPNGHVLRSMVGNNRFVGLTDGQLRADRTQQIDAVVFKFTSME